MIYSRLRLGDTVTIEALPDIKYAKSVSVAPFQDTIEGLSGDLFDVFVKPYFSNKFLLPGCGRSSSRSCLLRCPKIAPPTTVSWGRTPPSTSQTMLWDARRMID
jgi:hypothetical protein